MKKNVFVLVALLLGLCGCQEKTASLSFEKEETIEFQPVDYPELLGVTVQLKWFKGNLYVNNFHGDTLLSVYDVEKKHIKQKMISKGEGPGELFPPLDLQTVGDDLFVVSRPLFSLYRVSADHADRVEKIYQLPSQSDCFLPLTETQFVFSGLWGKQRYAWLDTSSDQLQTFGSYPHYWEAEEDIPDDAKAMFHQCFFGRNDALHRFASCSGYALDIYQYDPEKATIPQVYRQIQLGKYQYDYNTEGFITTKLRSGSDLCVTEMAVTTEYLYLVAQSQTNKRNRDIWVVDWDGNPVKRLCSDKRILCLTIDESHHRGYAIIEDPEEKLVSFQL